MLSKRFAGLVLGLLYAFCAIKESSAYTRHEGSEMPGHGLINKRENVVFVGKESLGKVPRIAAARKTKLGRRKMAVNEVWMKEAVEEMEGLKGKTSDISTGKVVDASKTTHGRSTNHPSDQDTGSSLSSSGSNDRVSEDTQGASQKDESQRLLEAAEEIAKLMRRDYRGRPLPRPPIHNNEPKN